MNPFATIRAELNVTQSELASELGVSQGNVSHYEKGRQAVPLRIARLLIAYAAKRGKKYTLDDVYPPEPVRKRPRSRQAAPAATT